jgi:hypothetical protein
MWITDQSGAAQFSGGKESWLAATAVASDCRSFSLDVDEEIVADEERSCYNCRYRRWTASSFTCQASVPV